MFGPDGGLVANAPHIPVHLGAMQETIRYQVIYFEHVTGAFRTMSKTCDGTFYVKIVNGYKIHRKTSVPETLF